MADPRAKPAKPKTAPGLWDSIKSDIYKTATNVKQNYEAEQEGKRMRATAEAEFAAKEAAKKNRSPTPDADRIKAFEKGVESVVGKSWKKK